MCFLHVFTRKTVGDMDCFSWLMRALHHEMSQTADVAFSQTFHGMIWMRFGDYMVNLVLCSPTRILIVALFARAFRA